MTSQYAVKIDHLSKKFAKGTSFQMRYGLADSLRLVVGADPVFSKLRQEEFWALQNISLKVKKGGSLGIIGSNGSGKSTLLKMLAGIYSPDAGQITINGEVGALIELGAGFHPELTGRENIFLNASILGMKKTSIEEKFNDIVKFSELDEFIDVPIKNYSSGMYARLGFSIIAFVQPEILLIDEILSVGDIHFRQKSWEKIKELHSSNSTLILVAHNLMSIQTLCEDTIWLEKGKMVAYGETDSVLEQYYDFANKKALETEEVVDPMVRKGSGEIRINQIQILNQSHKSISEINWSDPLIIRMSYQLNKPVYDPKKVIFRIQFAEPSATSVVTYAHTYRPLSISSKTGHVDFIFPNINLSPKTYIVNGLILHQDKHYHIYDFWAKAGGPFKVVHNSYTKQRNLIMDSTIKLPYETHHCPDKL